MTDAVLLFTFSPIQSFIMEARRAADLYVGSQILVELARSAAAAITDSSGTLIYPTAAANPASDKLPVADQKPALHGRDIPNKLVARVPAAQANDIATAARDALLQCWDRIAQEAHDKLAGIGMTPDEAWQAIWTRQTSGLWEVFWSSAEIQPDASGDGYAAAYGRASRALDAVKRSRVFAQVAEPGRKDTLSGRREALHTMSVDARGYWSAASADPQITAAKLRPSGRERLDSIGSVKRFCKLATRPFPSTSTVASWHFLSPARSHLKPYTVALQALLGAKLHAVRVDPDWPYDGDLLYLETLTRERLQESYGAGALDEEALAEAVMQLREVYRLVGDRPPLYYGIILLDGDNMGARVSACLDKADPQAEHRGLSGALSRFADTVRPTVFELNDELDAVIYNGGDDVLALAPLTTAVTTAKKLADDFNDLTDGSASAGIAIAHHTYPLSAALRAARSAERSAKALEDKAAICVRVVKRGGEALEVRSPWAALSTNLDDLVAAFGCEPAHLAAGLAYDAERAAYALPDPDDMWQSEMRRLIARHRNLKTADPLDPAALAARLADWADALPGKTAELADWLIFARFLAQAGGE